MSVTRRLASRLLRAVLRHSPDSSREWASAMLRELDFIESNRAAMFWALGSTTAVFRQSVRGVMRWFGRRKRHEEAPMIKDVGKKAAGIAAGMVMATGLGLGALGLLVLSFHLFPT